MKILVTGANGLLGHKLVSLLSADNNIHLIATARGPLTQSLTSGEFHNVDITDRITIERVINLTKPDVVINTAAMTQVDQCEVQHEACWAVNVEAVQNLIISCERNQVHLVHVSTDFIFDGSFGPLDESAIPSPVNFYGESKLAAEKLIQQSTLQWTIIRTVLVYGITSDMSRSNIVLWVKNSLEEKKTIQVVNDQWRTPTLAEDLAMGCYLAAVKKVQGIYHISGQDFLTPYDIALLTADFFSLDKNLIKATDSSHFTQPAKRPAKTGFIIDKARNELGYEPHSFSEGLQIIAQQLK